MKSVKSILVCLICFILITPVFGQESVVRIKDIGKIIEARDNQLLGFGLVVGLRNSGDTKSTGFTHLALRNLLSKLGVPSGGQNFNSRNVASVMVTASLPPFVKPGQRISVTVSALGDSRSLVGGTLLLTPLQGPDMQTYAVAQGPVVVSGLNERTQTARLVQNQTTVGIIPQGAIVEEEVPVTFEDQHNITIVLNEPNFMTVSRATEAIKEFGFLGAKAIDGSTIKIPLSDIDSSDLISTIAEIQDITLVPDSSSRIIINSRTGTVVIGEKVRLYPVALTHGSISIRISEEVAAAEGAAPEDPIQVDQGTNQLVFLNPTDTLSSLVNALNELGATPKDLISIIQALKESGALIAQIEVL
ncbi:flagellar biosynthesis protein FlgA [Candidatus Marinamargulisbacteria bacterium SCGC AG-410-N11]|nr:flagellar biosynthesis protein FlgA [Candidatus Marinamargulisbacteria bacterium SCGC AG-410-N11]